MKKAASSKGFTLIEIMVVVAIVGIISAIAYPSYQEHVRKTRRVDAQANLMELAQFMERYHTAKGTYVGAELPYDQSPKDGGKKAYTLAFDGDVKAGSYKISATPANMMASDKCGTLSIESTGRKSSSKGAGCW